MSEEQSRTHHHQSTDLRYEARRVSGGAWMVVDAFTDLPAASDGRDLVNLRKDDALDMAAELNRCDIEGSASPLVWHQAAGRTSMREITWQFDAIERASFKVEVSSARLAADPSSMTFAPSIDTFRFVQLIRGSAATAASIEAVMLAVEQPANWQSEGLALVWKCMIIVASLILSKERAATDIVQLGTNNLAVAHARFSRAYATVIAEPENWRIVR